MSRILPRPVLASLLALWLVPPALALDHPKPQPQDPRLTTLVFDPHNITKLHTHYGYITQIVLAEGESVLPQGVYLGDSEAWQVATHGNQVLIKPQQANAATNLILLTNRRHYQFDLDATWPVDPKTKTKGPSAPMVWRLQFDYPQDRQISTASSEAQRLQALAAAAQAAEQQKRLNEKTAAVNWDYFVQGSPAITPDEVSDDGRFTRLLFRNNREVPAIFAVNDQGEESLVNFHMEQDTVVVHALAPAFVLRKGSDVVRVSNRRFDPVGIATEHGSSLPRLQRTLKGDE